MKRALRWAVPVLVVALAIAGAYRLRATADPPSDFSDDLKGPGRENLVIPFEAFAMTPEGLLRDFVFEIDVTIPAATRDLAYVGFGLGANNPAYNNEPAGAFMFRIHNLPGVDTVHAAASRLPSTQPAEPGPQVFARLEALGHYIPGRKTTFRIEHGGNRVTLSIPDQAGASHT